MLCELNFLLQISLFPYQSNVDGCSSLLDKKTFNYANISAVLIKTLGTNWENLLKLQVFMCTHDADAHCCLLWYIVDCSISRMGTPDQDRKARLQMQLHHIDSS